MPTSAVGSKPLQPSPKRAAAAGLTLLELMVVVALIAITTAAASLSLRDSADARVEREAVRLASLLESARARSRASGMPVVWQLREHGFSFEGLPERALPQQWLEPSMQVRSGAPVLLGPEPLIGAQAIALGLPGQDRAWWVVSDGLRPFRAQRQAGTMP
jgi:general secretion pathway protein H